jgi:VWFA-related protein
MKNSYRWMVRLALVVVSVMVPVTIAADRDVAAQAVQAVPADLKPLLAGPTSEMRLVVTRYTLDRNTLSGNYAGGSGRGGGRGGGGGVGGGGGAAPAGPVPLSSARLSRLKRFDLDWQAAAGKIDSSKFSSAAKADLGSLLSSIDTNLKQIETDALTIAQVMPALPFATKVVGLIEARIRVQDLNPQKAAEMTMAIVKDAKDMRAAFEANASGAPRLNKAIATRAADATAQLRTGITEWFNFYNTYDPMFSWWMGLPFKHMDAALQEYATVLRDKVAAAALPAPAMPASVPAVQPVPAQKYASVPDLTEIIGLPQDEMRDIVARFNASRSSGRGGRGGGRGGDAAAGAVPAGPTSTLFTDWLTALKTLDFDRLSRNAQVDYLFIKRQAETEIARAGTTIPAGPPRKADTSDIQGRPRGRAGLIQDLSDNMIPYTPEQLIALANREYAWCEAEMKKASREMGFGDDWKKAVEKTKETYVPPGGQPRMIMDLLDEAVAYLRANDLITVPAVAAESLHMIMMTPQQQLTSPFFLGGSQILVSYPTDTMEYDARMQSMRGNNPGFSHATAFHEMIPGHNLVGYLNQRYADYRPDLTSGGPFYGEGWPLYWELTMYELGFDKTGGPAITFPPEVDWYHHTASISTLNGVMQYLKTLPERRKVVVYVSVGVPIDQEKFNSTEIRSLLDHSMVATREGQIKLFDEMKRIFEQARPANVNIYVVDPSGFNGLENYIYRLTQSMEAAHQLATLHLDFLQTVASNTDGLAIINTNAPEARVPEIFRENGSYYLIGYQPLSGQRDGSLHRLEVRVNRPDVHVRSRNFTEAPTEKSDKAAKEASPLAKALSGVLPDPNVPLRVVAAPFALPGGKTAAVVLTLGVQQAIPEGPPGKTGRVVENIDLQTSAFTLEGEPRGTSRRKATIALLPGAAGDVRYEVLSRIDLKPGRYELRLAAHSSTMNKSGSVYADVVVPDFAGEALSLSGLVLGATPALASAPKAALASLLPFSPTSERTFDRMSRVVVFARVYEGGKGPLAPVAVTTSILNDHDEKVFDQSQSLTVDRFNVTARAADYRIEIPLKQLQPGAHVLVMDATLGKASARRNVVFEVR